MIKFRKKISLSKSKIAFTLAEMLITLGIIGIVAVLVIPALVKNYQTRVWDKASSVFAMKLEEALKVMNTQEKLAGYSNTEDFVNELSRQIKITKICKMDDLTSCFEDKVYWGVDNEEIEINDIKDAKNFGHDDWGTDIVGVMFGNGTTGLIAYNPGCKQDPYSNQIDGTSCLAILYDTNAYKNPDTQNKDLRSINVISLKGSSCAIRLSDGTCLTTPFQPEAMTEAECVEEKDKLGIDNCKFSSTGRDCWAGAVRACGGVKNMPTKDNLRTLAQDLYPGTDINSDELIYGNRDSDLAASMGFIDRRFFIWSAEEAAYSGDYSYRYSYVRSFLPDRTVYMTSNSALDSYMLNPIYTVCLSN